ncbi:MAG TPA: lasso peptide isopeptide bond-forming cyclase, partial [Armatimonadota bacterium]|nr:lasso peptide isopeptide bond-forming cyclase [Armatimonadota bacterium]
MSAIAGVWCIDGRPAEPALLERMAETLAHRGPDGAGVWCEGAVGLAHRALRTTPEAFSETLPLVSPNGAFVLTADARLDNRRELLAAFALPLDDVCPDSELILRAYERWGSACPQKLAGDFAFAIWDARARKLFCARDRFGVRPFCYHHTPGRAFVFGTEIKALLCVPQVSRRLNEERVGDHVLAVLEDKEATFYRDILRLPPAHSLTVSTDGLRREAYWSLDPERQVRCSSDEDYAESFREHFCEAVRCRLRSSVPLGAMLSGGLDSSSVVCTARDLRRQGSDGPLAVFSLLFDAVPQCDERAFIESVIAQGDLVPHYLRGDEVSPLAGLDQLCRLLDEPLFGPNRFLMRTVWEAAHGAGCRVVLDGFDGDTTVSHGMVRLTELAATGRWIPLAAEAREYGRVHRVRVPGLLWKHAVRPLIPVRGSLRSVWRSAHRDTVGAAAPDPLINPAFAARAGIGDRLARLQGESAAAPRTERGHHLRRLTTGLLPFVVEQLGQGAAMFGMEPRHPFLDHRLAEFSLALPGDQKLRHGWRRLILRRAMEGILPSQVQWRPGKTDLSPNFTRALLRFERERMDE